MTCLSFYNGTYKKEDAKKIVKETLLPTYTRYGFAYRGAEKHRAPKETLLKIIEEEPMIDLYIYEDCIVLNTYSNNDML